MEVKLRNITNAFVRLEIGDMVLLLDPWLTDGIYDGGWMNYPPVMDPARALNGDYPMFVLSAVGSHSVHDAVG